MLPFKDPGHDIYFAKIASDETTFLNKLGFYSIILNLPKPSLSWVLPADPAAITASFQVGAQEFSAASQQQFTQALSTFGINVENSFLSIDNLLSPFEGLFSAFQDALYSYLQLDEGSFITKIQFLGEYAGVQSVPNFLNLSFEQLFEVPVAEDGNDALMIAFSGSLGAVESISVPLNLGSDGRTADIISVLSEPRSLSVPPPLVFSTSTPPVTVPTGEGTPGIPTTPTQTIDNAESGALNFASPILYSGNFFKAGPYNSNKIASFGPDGGSVISADFAELLPGSSITNIRGAIILTLPDNNSLTIYTANINGQKVGDYVYTLVAPHLIANTTAEIVMIEGQRYFIDSFEYSLTSIRGITRTGVIDVIVQDDNPVATDLINLTPVAESNIPGIGSNLLSTPNTLTGSLLTSATAAEPNYFGANGGSVSNVTIEGGATIVGATTIIVTDPFGNELVINRINGEYTYTLSNPMTNLNGAPIFEIFHYEFTDNNGNVASANLTIKIEDDVPIAININDMISEENIENTGSAGALLPNTIAGLLVSDTPTLSTSRYGADGAASEGGVTNVIFSSVSGATANGITPITATTTVGTITQTIIDNSNGALTSENLGNKAIVVTDSIGNQLIVDALTSQYVYTLNQAFHQNIADTSATVIFTYQLTDGDGSSSSGQLAVTVEDDRPVATYIEAGLVDEANIPIVGSAGETDVNVLTGVLISPSGSQYGADGPASTGGIVNVQLSGVEGAEPLTAVTTFGEITQLDIDNSNGGFTQDNLGNTSIIVTDSAGNTFVVDVLTSQYVYTLNNALTQITANTTAQIQYTITYQDSDNSQAFGALSIIIDDDQPTAVADFNSVSPEGSLDLIFTFVQPDATFNNSFGYYIKDSNGNPTVGAIIWAGSQDTSIGTTFSIPVGIDPNDVGYFLIPDGANVNPGLANGDVITFQQVTNTDPYPNYNNGLQWVGYDEGGNPILGYDGQGTPPFPMILYDNADFNPLGLTLVQMDPDGTMRWEDSPLGQDPANFDFNDLIIGEDSSGGTGVPTMSGNIIANDVQGADGNVSVTEVGLNFASLALAMDYIDAHPELNATLNGTSVSISVPDNTTLVIVTPNGAEFQISSNGDYTYSTLSTTPGTESFDYTIVDGDNSPSTSTVTFEIIDPNNSLMSMSIFSGDTDMSSSSLSTEQFLVTDNFMTEQTYVAPSSEQSLNTDSTNSPTADVTTTEDGTPVANQDVATTSSSDQLIVDATQGILSNDTDPNVGDSLSVAAINGFAVNVGSSIILSSGATLIVAADGSYHYDPTTSVQLSSLAENTTAVDSFSYQVKDQAGNVSNVATVDITVTAGTEISGQTTSVLDSQDILPITEEIDYSNLSGTETQNSPSSDQTVSESSASSTEPVSTSGDTSTSPSAPLTTTTEPIEQTVQQVLSQST